MAKTTHAINEERGKVWVDVDAAAVAALVGLTTAEEIDLSSCVREISIDSHGEAPVAGEDDYVIDDDTPLIEPSARLGSVGLTITFYYTQGKETLGTDSLDPVEGLFRPMKNLGGDRVPLPIAWSVGKGAVGDIKYSTSDSDSYVTDVEYPAFGSGGNKVLINVKVTASSASGAPIT